MASLNTRRDDIQRLKTRELVLQNLDGTHAQTGTVPFLDHDGSIVTDAPVLINRAGNLDLAGAAIIRNGIVQNITGNDSGSALILQSNPTSGRGLTVLPTTAGTARIRIGTAWEVGQDGSDSSFYIVDTSNNRIAIRAGVDDTLYIPGKLIADNIQQSGVYDLSGDMIIHGILKASRIQVETLENITSQDSFQSVNSWVRELKVGTTDTTQIPQAAVDVIGSILASVDITALGKLSIGGTASVTGDISGGSLSTGGSVTTGGAVTATGTVSGGSITTAGTVTATGDISGGSLSTRGTVTATGAVSGGSITTAGAITGGAISGSSVNANGGTISGGAISGSSVNANGGAINGGAISGSSVTAINGGAITGGAISGNSVYANGGAITGGAISGSSVTATGAISGTSITISGASGIGTVFDSKYNIPPMAFPVYSI